MTPPGTRGRIPGNHWARPGASTSWTGSPRRAAWAARPEVAVLTPEPDDLARPAGHRGRGLDQLGIAGQSRIRRHHHPARAGAEPGRPPGAVHRRLPPPASVWHRSQPRRGTEPVGRMELARLSRGAEPNRADRGGPGGRAEPGRAAGGTPPRRREDLALRGRSRPAAATGRHGPRSVPAGRQRTRRRADGGARRGRPPAGVRGFRSGQSGCASSTRPGRDPGSHG